MTRYTVCADTIEDAILKSADLVYREVICGESIEPDDHIQKGLSHGS